MNAEIPSDKMRSRSHPDMTPFALRARTGADGGISGGGTCGDSCIGFDSTELDAITGSKGPSAPICDLNFKALSQVLYQGMAFSHAELISSCWNGTPGRRALIRDSSRQVSYEK